MTSLELANRFKEVTLNGKLVAYTNIAEQINNLSVEQATQQIGNLNTVALLVFHLTYYIKGVAEVFKGGELTIRDKYSFDSPKITTEQDWVTLRTDFLESSLLFAQLIEQLSTEELKNNFVKPEYGTIEKNLNVMIEHCYYHLGQIVLINKLNKG